MQAENDGLEVQYDILISDLAGDQSLRQQIDVGLRDIDDRLELINAEVDRLNSDIAHLTNNADGLDYMVAVGSGVLAGLVDSLWVGEFDFKSGKAWSNKSVNDFVMRKAKKKRKLRDPLTGEKIVTEGYTGNHLKGAIAYLEDTFHIPSDSIFEKMNDNLKVGEKISKKTHHLDDLAHHPTPVGLFFSILTQFTEHGYFSNNAGQFLPIDIDDSGLIGNGIPNKLFCGTVNWFLHLVSDMSSSNKTAGAGMGIPGPIVSLLKEFSALPGINKTGLSKKIKETFVNERFDLRSELAVGHEISRQAMPVLFNEVFVRAFYFLRRLIVEVRETKDFDKIVWQNTIPFKNRTIVRMLTIATGTFTALDLWDATIRGVTKSAGNPALFSKSFILCVNFVGVGRFGIAVGVDISMGFKRRQLIEKRTELYFEQMGLTNAKVQYKLGQTWLCLADAYRVLGDVTVNFASHLHRVDESGAKADEALDDLHNLLVQIEQEVAV